MRQFAGRKTSSPRTRGRTAFREHPSKIANTCSTPACQGKIDSSRSRDGIQPGTVTAGTFAVVLDKPSDCPKRTVGCPSVRLIVARCEVAYTGRLNAFLPDSTRLIMLKSD